MTPRIKVWLGSNAELFSKLMTGDLVDLGDGLSCRMAMFIHRELDFYEFHFELEGQDIGSLDCSLGGWIGRDGSFDEKLFYRVIDRMEELFPGKPYHHEYD